MMKKFLRYIIPIAATLLVGCSSGGKDPDIEVPDEPRPDEVTLCLNVSFNGETSTRADNDPDRYDPASGDYEKISTLRVIIVHDIKKNDVSGATTALVEGNRLVATNDQGNPLYDNLEFKVRANDDKRIYLIANEKFLTPPSSTSTSSYPTATRFLDSFEVTTDPKLPKEVNLDALSAWTISIPSISASTTNVDPYATGMFSPVEGNLLPLTEFFNISVGGKEETTDNRWYSHLFLTRCAAKAQFLLNVGSNFSNGAITPSIKSISLSGIGTKEFVFPNEAEYSQPKSDLISDSGVDHDPGKPEAYIKNFKTPTDNKLVTYRLTELTNNNLVSTNGSKVQLTNKPVYFPESILSIGAEYEVTVELSDGRILSAPLKNDIATGTVANILQIGNQKAIARNTFLPIELNFSGAADLTVSVIKWTPETYEFDFKDQVGQDQYDFLVLENGTYESIDWNTGELVMKPYPNVFSGTFGLSSPLGARWDAYLITLTGDQDIIQFQTIDQQGNISYSTHISGQVGGINTIKVTPTALAGSDTRSAILQVTVTMLSGLTVPVNILLNGEGGDNQFAPGVENLIFVQHPQ